MNGRIRKVEVSSSLTFPGSIHVRSYLCEDLLFGKSFSRCQPAAGRTELTARTPQFLFPLPLPSSTSGLRLLLRLFAISYPFTRKDSSFEFDSAGLRSALYNSKLKFLGRWPLTYRNFVMLLRFEGEFRQCKFNDGIRYYDYLRRNYLSSYRCTNSRLSVKRSQQWAWFIVEFTTNNISSTE